MTKTGVMAATGTTLTGAVISAGAAFGYALREDPLTPLVPDTPAIPPAAIEHEVARLTEAYLRVRTTLEDHVRDHHAPHDEDHDDILAAHLLMLDDQHFTQTIVDRIRSERIPADHAVEHAFSVVADRLVFRGDPYLQARAEEIRDLCQSLRRALGDADRSPESRQVRSPVVYVSSCLSGTAVLRARRAKAVAFVSSSRAFTSHGAILLRASGIPALGGVDLATEPLETGTPVLVNATDELLVIRPDADQLKLVTEPSPTSPRTRGKMRSRPCVIPLQDGSNVRLLANIDHPSQAGSCLDQRLSGIGLFRTEFLVLEAGRVPTEEEQLARYQSVLEQDGTLPVMIRTFDLGGDKTIAGLHRCAGPNPALGVRGLRRHILRHPDELKTQLRAILRAAIDHRVGVLLPMVTNLGDVEEARALLEASKNDLTASGEGFNTEVLRGAMIEVPAAALNLAAILPRIDFVSIGTNDLLQYLTASDRDNEEVLHYQDGESSGLTRMLELVMTSARASGRHDDVTVCGELASTSRGAQLLVDLGYRSLSISPAVAPAIRTALEAEDG